MNTQIMTNKKLALVGTTTLLVGALLAGQAQAGTMKADFNRDGYEDLVVGVPNESIAGLSRAGAVKVVYGRADGTWRTHSKTTYLHQNKYGESGVNLFGVLEANDKFGASIAVGDFNNDGYDDLAIGTPDESIGNQHYKVGAVNIVYGGFNGLGQSKNHLLKLERYKNGQYLRNYNHFGTALTVGD